MFNLAQLFSVIKSGTNYPATFSPEKVPAYGAKGDPVKVYLKYFAMTPSGQIGDGIIVGDYYNQFGEELVQVFQVEFFADVASCHTVWQKLYDTLAGWVPLEETIPEFSGLSYAGGGRMGMASERIYWMDNWKIDMPKAPKP